MQIVTQRLGENDVIHYQAPESQDVPRQIKALLAWLNDVSGGMSTEKYVAISGVSRATAYRELTDLVAQQLLTISGQGRATRYALV